MMKLSLTIIFFCVSLFWLNAQTIPNHKFEWSTVGTCLPKGVCNEVYLKAEKDPYIDQYSKKDFQYLISNGISSIKLESNISGTLKLKLLFLPDKALCLNEVGSLGIEIPEDKLTSFSKLLDVIDQITYARMNSQSVKSEGLMYLVIRQGKLESMRVVKFKLREET